MCMDNTLLKHYNLEIGVTLLIIKDSGKDPIITSLSENETTRIFTESSDIEDCISKLGEKEKEKKEIAKMLSKVPNL